MSIVFFLPNGRYLNKIGLTFDNILKLHYICQIDEKKNTYT